MMGSNNSNFAIERCIIDSLFPNWLIPIMLPGGPVLLPAVIMWGKLLSLTHESRHNFIDPSAGLP